MSKRAALPYAEIGARIAACRKRFGLTQREFAEQLDVRKSTYARIEIGEQRPSVEFLDVLHQKFAMSPHFVVTGDPPPDGHHWSEQVSREDLHEVDQLAPDERRTLRELELAIKRNAISIGEVRRWLAIRLRRSPS